MNRYDPGEHGGRDGKDERIEDSTEPLEQRERASRSSSNSRSQRQSPSTTEVIDNGNVGGYEKVDMSQIRIGAQNVNGINETKVEAMMEMMEDMDLDILAVNESSLRDGSEEEVKVRQVLNQRFQWHGKCRQDRVHLASRGKVGGGVGFLIRIQPRRQQQQQQRQQQQWHCQQQRRKQAWLGAITVTKQSESDGIMWIEMRSETTTLYLASVYLPPATSFRSDTNPALLEELCEDIHLYQQQGMVIVMGDFNRRICTLSSVIYTEDGMINLPRLSVDDSAAPANAFELARGVKLMDLMSQCDMVVMNGIMRTDAPYTRADYTCTRYNSFHVLDYIMVDYSHMQLMGVVETNHVWPKLIDTDHSLIHALITLPVTGPETQAVVEPAMAVHSPSRSDQYWTNDKGERSYWNEYQQQLILECAKWNEQADSLSMQQLHQDTVTARKAQTQNRIDTLWSSLRDAIKHALAKTVGVKRRRQKIKQTSANSSRCLSRRKPSRTFMYMRDDAVRQLSREKERCFNEYKQALSLSDEEIARARKQLKSANRKLGTEVRNKRKEAMTKQMQAIQSIRTTETAEYWKMLKHISRWQQERGVNTRHHTIPSDSVLDGQQQVHRGKRAVLKVWKQTYQSTNQYVQHDVRYDAHTQEQVTNQLQQLQHHHTEEAIEAESEEERDQADGILPTSQTLNKRIELEEVEEAIARMKRNKAGGVDGLVNECIKYGGKVMHETLCQAD